MKNNTFIDPATQNISAILENGLRQCALTILGAMAAIGADWKVVKTNETSAA